MPLVESVKSLIPFTVSPRRALVGALGAVLRIVDPPAPGAAARSSWPESSSAAAPIAAPLHRFFDNPVVDLSRFRSTRAVPGPKPKAIELLPAERAKLEQASRSRTGTAESAYRARIILTLADAPGVSAAARLLGFSRNTIALWRDRFLARGEKGLETLPIPGRAPAISDIARVNLIGMACGTPADFGIETRTSWTHESLCEAYLAYHPDLDPISVSTIQRVLQNADLKPHRLRLWLHSPDPEFRQKVTEICTLYRQAPEGATVLCFDEKTGMQALGRKNPNVPPAPRLTGRKEFEYVRPRGGPTGHAPFWLPSTPTRARSSHSADPLEPPKTCSNSWRPWRFTIPLGTSTLSGTISTSITRAKTNAGPSSMSGMATASIAPATRFHYTPIHASWVNQVELFFGIFSKRVLKNADFDSVKALEKASDAFIDHWNAYEKHPFAWKFKGYPLVNTS